MLCPPTAASAEDRAEGHLPARAHAHYPSLRNHGTPGAALRACTLSIRSWATGRHSMSRLRRFVRVRSKRPSIASCTASQRETCRRADRIISNKIPPLDGAGAHRRGSRWANGGRWVLHAGETYPLAALESLAHWQTSTLPPTLVCGEITIPDDVAQARITRAEIAGLQDDDHKPSRAVGDASSDRPESAVQRAPSVVSPIESNVLFDKCDPDIVRIIVGATMPAHGDGRLTCD